MTHPDPAFLLTPRDAAIVAAVAGGEIRAAVAKRFGLSAGSISNIVSIARSLGFAIPDGRGGKGRRGPAVAAVEPITQALAGAVVPAAEPDRPGGDTPRCDGVDDGEPVGIPLLERGRHHCAWVLDGAPRMAARVCGAPVSGETSWCRAHRRRVFASTAWEEAA